MRPPSTAQSYLRFPLTRLFGGGGTVRVLRALALRGAPMSATQLAQECGLSRRGVHLILEGLSGQRIVEALGANKVQLFQLDRGNPLVAALQDLFSQEHDRWGELLRAVREALKGQLGASAAWYFGSVARGEDAPQSDFDIAVAVPDDRQVDALVEEIRQVLRPIEDKFYVAFSVIGLSNADIARLQQDGDEWWANVTRDAKVLKGVSPQQYVKTIAS
jgi:predicted nucleotidyltransferase